MRNTKLAGTLLVLTLLAASGSATAASVITVAYEASKNDAIIKNTNIMTFAGAKLRVDYLGSESKRSKTTPFLLTTDNGKSWVLGNQDEGTYYCASMATNEFFNVIGNLITKIDSYTSPEYSNTRVEQTLEEAGPKIFDHPTVHVRIQSSTKVKAAFLFKTFEFEINKVDDFWYARDMQMHPARQHWIEALTHSGYAHFDNLSQQIRGSIKGALLRQETVMLVTDLKKKKTDRFGRKINITSVKEVKDSELAADIFTKPACRDISKDQVKDVAKGMFKEGKLTL